MTAAYTVRIQLDEFEVPAIPDGHKLVSIEVAEARRSYPKCETIYVADYDSEGQSAESKAIERALDYVIREIGWNRAQVCLDLVRTDDHDIEGRMIYDCDSDCWTQFIDEIDAVPLGVMPRAVEEEEPTGVIHPRYAAVVDDAEAMEVER